MALLKAAKPVLSYIFPQSWLGSDVNTASDDVSRAAAENQRLREDLALAYRALAYYDLHESVMNHLSVRAPARNGKGEVMLITAHEMHWTQITASSLIGVDFQTGEVIEGDGDVLEAGKNIHLALHNLKAPNGIKCVMHTHQPYVTALACCRGRVMNVHQTSMRFHNKIAYDDSYGGVASTEDEGARISSSFGDKNICILGNHGVAAVGKRICDVFDDLYYLERACMYQVMAMSTGLKLTEMPEEIAEEIANWEDADHFKEAHFEAIRKIISKHEPDYKS